ESPVERTNRAGMRILRSTPRPSRDGQPGLTRALWRVPLRSVRGTLTNRRQEESTVWAGHTDYCSPQATSADAHGARGHPSLTHERRLGPYGISPRRMVVSFAVSMFPPETTHATFPFPARPESAAATEAAPAPSATTRPRSTSRRTAAATSASGMTSEPA